VSPSERTGVLVLRVWIEAGSESGLRARITTEDELGSQERVSVVAGSVEQVVELVEQWVQGFVSG
jgi:hypothetical protein